MAAPSGKDWFLRDWMASLSVKQVDLIEPTGWAKSKISDLYNGKARYTRDVVNLLASVLNIEPFELLMEPDDAMRMRRLRDTALSIAADNKLEYRPGPPLAGKAARRG